MMNREEQSYIKLMTAVLDEIVPDILISRKVQEDIYVELDNLTLKKVIYMMKQNVIATEGIEEIYEENISIYNQLIKLTEKDFMELKEDIKFSLNAIEETKKL